MITQHSFMFINTYHDLRKYILDNMSIRDVVHLGPHAFEDISGEVVNTVMFVFKKRTTDSISTFFRLVESSSKGENLIQSINENCGNIYRVEQSSFKLISGYPFVYFAGSKILNIFRNPNLEKIIDIPGSQNITANNDKYLRFFWEVSSRSIGVDSKWVFYAKGGEFCKYYGNLDLVVDWDENARSFYKRNKTSNLLNESYWYKEGATYTEISSKGFNIRYLPPRCIFDKKGPSFFVKNTSLDILYLIGFCNTKLFSYLIHMLNPTISYQVIDVKRIPFLLPKKEYGTMLSDKAKSCIDIKKSLLRFIVNDYEFELPAIQWGYNKLNEK